MDTKLNQAAVDQAKELIKQGKVVLDEHGDWTESKPDPEAENRFLDREGFVAYGRWHLGVKPGEDPEEKGSYSFPYGDFRRVHRSGLIAVEQRAAQYGHREIEAAAKELLGLLPDR